MCFVCFRWVVDVTESLNRNRRPKDASLVQRFKSYNLQKEWEVLKYVHECCICNWATPWDNLFMPYANNKGADQPAHPCSLISTFVVRYLDSMISLVSVSEISSLYIASVAAQAGLSLPWSQTPKTVFLVMRLTYSLINKSLYYHTWLKLWTLLWIKYVNDCKTSMFISGWLTAYEPRHKKTCFWGFRQGEIQTGLPSWWD